MNFRKKNFVFIIMAILIFLFTYIFFTRVHPLIIFDSDDWGYITFSRRFMPIFNIWNPAKLFPETFMPLMSSIAAFVIYPITNDYIDSFTIITAFVVSIFISLYIYTFAKMIKRVFSLNYSSSILLSVLFFIFHFLLFKSADLNNEYMFLAHNVNCYYNYLIPNLLNYIIVFSLIAKKDDKEVTKSSPLKMGVFLLVIYVAIFSNLYCNIILAVYAGSHLIISFLDEFKSKINIKNFIKTNFTYIGIILAWLVSLFFELTGGRAQYSYQGSFASALFESLKNMGKSILSLNKIIVLLLVIVTFIFLIKFISDVIKNKVDKNTRNLFINLLICELVIIIYFVLISSKVNPVYMLHAEYIYGLWAYGLILVFMFSAYLIKSYPKTLVIFPILIAFFIVELNCSLWTFKESNTQNINPKVCKEIDENLIYQFKKAEENGLSNINLYVPKYENEGNWPHNEVFGIKMSSALYRHRILKKWINVRTVPDENYNEKK